MGSSFRNFAVYVLLAATTAAAAGRLWPLCHAECVVSTHTFWIGMWCLARSTMCTCSTVLTDHPSPVHVVRNRRVRLTVRGYGKGRAGMS